jgi:hypothetical protein
MSENDTAGNKTFRIENTAPVQGQNIGDHNMVYQRFNATPPERYQEHVLSVIRSYDKQSANKKVIHHILQLTIFVGAALVTVIVGIPEVPKLLPALLSGIVTIATAIANYYKFGEHSRDLYLTSEDLAQEYNWFDTKRGQYKGKSAEAALELFMDRTETLIRKQTKHSFALEQQKEKPDEGN